MGEISLMSSKYAQRVIKAFFFGFPISIGFLYATLQDPQMSQHTDRNVPHNRLMSLSVRGHFAKITITLDPLEIF